MKQKERKEIAKKIAKCEKIIRDSQDTELIYKAQEEIMTLAGKVQSLDDMVIIDELVQNLLDN